VAVHEAIEDACPCWFADGRGDCGDGGVALMNDMHTLTLDEVWGFGNGDSEP
jgi:hypothetical protein